MITKSQLQSFKVDLVDGTVIAENGELIDTCIDLWNVVQMVELLMIRWKKGLPVKEHLEAMESILKGLT